MTSHEIDVLIKKIAHGDIEALEHLYTGMKKPVYFYALRLSNNTDIAEDVMQDTFISIMSNSGSYIPKGKGSAWIFTIVKNKILDYQKKQKPSMQIDEQENLIDPSCQIENFINKNMFFEMLTPLNKKERDIVILRILVGFTLTEAARELNLPKGSVFWTYNNAMKKLKKALKGENDYV
ncbi:MAG: sigma-70 family RNA polymerase sigma factor [Clostridiales bacterium]|jgi:RNA polymerase sigma-70 factor (ECF subfamily)|nr:sigma-70 family RNA polymerase sigma factor [Clostridiales bacterium]